MMQNYSWKIVKNESDSRFGIIVESSDPDSIWQFFFTGIDKGNYPKMVLTVIQEIGFCSNGVGVLFSSDLDPGDKVFPNNMVEVFHNDFGSNVIKKKDFYFALFDFATKLLEMESSDFKWKEDLAKAVFKLKKKWIE